jgi:NTE family protein
MPAIGARDSRNSRRFRLSVSAMGTPRTAFVLAGGGSLGAVEVGMLQALVERRIAPDLVVGASVGAVNGAYFAGRPDGAGVESLGAIWRGLRRGDVFPLGLVGGFLGFIGMRSHLLDPDRLRSLLERNLPLTRLEDAKVPCHVVATDVLSGEEVRLSSGPAVDVVLASAAIPAVFPPVRIGDRQLSDGALASNTPLSAALALGAERLIVLPTGFSCALERAPRSALGTALHAVNLLIARQLVVDIDRFCTLAEIVVVPPLCPLNVMAADFSRTGELIDRAVESTRRWLDGGGLSVREVPRALRPHAHYSGGGMPA